MRLLTAAVVAALAVTAPVPAHANGGTFYGGCRLTVLDDWVPGGIFGGDGGWTGEVDLAVVAKDLGPISAMCGLKVNGVDQGIVLVAPEHPVATAAAGQVTFTAPSDAVVTLYTTVTTNAGTETCDTGACTETAICPDSVCGDGGLLDQVFAVYDLVYEALKVLDPPICAQLVAAAPTVDSLPTADLLYIEPTTGDTYAGGTTPDYLFWDCPPYVTP